MVGNSKIYSFSPNVKKEIRQGWKYLQRSLINIVNLSEIFLGVVCYKKQVISLNCGFENMGCSKISVQMKGREVAIGKM